VDRLEGGRHAGLGRCLGDGYGAQPGWPDHRLIVRHKTCPFVSHMNNCAKEWDLEVQDTRGIHPNIIVAERCVSRRPIVPDTVLNPA
jgi:hypothetical protein